MRLRAIALCCALALLTAACGSRLSEDELQAGAGSSGGAPAAGGPAAGPGTGGDSGTLESPCGEAAGGEPAAPATEQPGITADGIRIAVISDRAGAVKVPTISIEESMKAFVGWCNAQGGINGRELELVTIDSKLFSHLEATREACESNVFAIVGSGSVTDNAGAQEMVDCGLIEVPAYTVTPAKSLSARLVAPLPNPPNEFPIGPARYVAAEHPDAIKKAAIIHGDIEAVNIQASRVIEAYEAEGYDFIYDKTTAVIQENYTSEVKAMKDAGVEYVTIVSATSEAVKLLRDMKTQGFEPEVVDLGQQFYDPDILAEPGSEGAIVLTNTVPFEEADDSPALQGYLAAYDAVSGDKPDPASLGVQSYSAGLLWATAMKAVGDDITRENVLAELHKITEWDGGGLHFVANPGENRGSDCFAYMVVKGGEFTRLHPAEPTTFDCDPSYRLELTGDYGEGAKE